MPASLLRVHVQNESREVDALHLSLDRMAAAIEARPRLKGRIALSEDGGAELPPGAMADCEVLFTTTKVSLGEARAMSPGLRWTQVTSAGVESLLATLPPDMLLTNASGVHSEKGGEFVLTAALMLTYDIPRFVTDQAHEVWSPRYGPTLGSKTVVILGVGAIGGAAVQCLKPFGCRVIGVTRTGRAEGDLDMCLGVGDLDEALGQADILVSTLPLTRETRRLVDRRRIGLLPAGAGIVVVGRARVLDYEALLDRLDAGTLRGAVLDVFPEEPIPQGDRLWTTPRVVVTPHCSVDDHSVYLERCLAIFVENLERYIAGAPLNNVVDPTLGY